MPPKKKSTTPPCYECGEPSEGAVSQSEKNPGRPYLRCPSCPSSNGQGTLFLGWADEYTGQAPKRRGKQPPKEKPKKRRHEFDEEEEVTEKESSEDEKPKKKKRIDLHSIPGSLPESASNLALDKVLRKKILDTYDQGEQILLQVKILNANLERLIELKEDPKSESGGAQ